MVVPKSVEQPDLFSPLCGTKHPKCGFIRQQWSCLILYFTSNNDSKNENNIIDHAIEVASDWLGSWVDLLSVQCVPKQGGEDWSYIELHEPSLPVRKIFDYQMCSEKRDMNTPSSDLLEDPETFHFLILWISYNSRHVTVSKAASWTPWTWPAPTPF